MNLHIGKYQLQLARSVAVIASTGALMIGATMAQTNIGSASLTANTFSTGNAGNLQIANESGATGGPGTFSTSATGFNFGSLTIGNTSPTHEHFWLKNTSSGAITLTLAASGVTLNNLDGTRVTVHVEKTGTTQDDSNSLSSLETTNASLSNPPATTDSSGVEYDVWVTLSSGAITSGTTGNASFDLNFTGTSS